MVFRRRRVSADASVPVALVGSADACTSGTRPASAPFVYRLCSIAETPEFLTMPFVLHGYRVYFPLVECVKSCLRWHNQSFNIHSHLAATAYFAALFASRASAPATELGASVAVLLFYAFAVALFAGSTVFHTFNCHSECAYARCNAADRNGIALAIIGAYVPIAYFSLACFPATQALHLSIFGAVAAVVMGVTQLPCTGAPSFIVGRICLFATLIATLVFSTWHISLLAGHDPHVGAFVANVQLAVAVLALGAVAYAGRIPERWAPGWFDYVGNSHNWLHVASTASLLMHVAGIAAIEAHFAAAHEPCAGLDRSLDWAPPQWLVAAGWPRALVPV